MEIPPLEVKELEDAIAPGEVPPLKVEGVEDAIATFSVIEFSPALIEALTEAINAQFSEIEELDAIASSPNSK
ncbi:hypothetical protein [Kamptonema sp. UHCC 0994]|uniref:hypothetical protein n=1 Tax=Kamptonema sp. UHCC 0994 TaxID=3031329 RepID=UPI0023BAEF4C|nr:hypothetical protein [Kamptonema sp. UHCC 0994]MDF0556679.1 hypothetical protein [Kamptonema sp. UHCC 0994]